MGLSLGSGQRRKLGAKMRTLVRYSNNNSAGTSHNFTYQGQSPVLFASLHIQFGGNPVDIVINHIGVGTVVLVNENTTDLSYVATPETHGKLAGLLLLPGDSLSISTTGSITSTVTVNCIAPSQT